MHNEHLPLQMLLMLLLLLLLLLLAPHLNNFTNPKSSVVHSSVRLPFTAHAFTSVPSLPLGQIPEQHKEGGCRMLHLYSEQWTVTRNKYSPMTSQPSSTVCDAHEAPPPPAFDFEDTHEGSKASVHEYARER